MFARRIRVEYSSAEGKLPAPLHWLDNFAMRNFTNDQIFDDTLPTGDGMMEIGTRVPLPLLAERLTDWCRRKGYISAGERLQLTEL